MSRLETWERRTAPLLTVLAAAALIALVLEAALDMRTVVGAAVDYSTWAVFAGAYAVRLYLAHDRWCFVREHLLDLAAVALPALRALRLVASIARVSAVAQRGLAERVLATTALIAATVVVAAAALGPGPAAPQWSGPGRSRAGLVRWLRGGAGSSRPPTLATPRP